MVHCSSEVTKQDMRQRQISGSSKAQMATRTRGFPAAYHLFRCSSNRTCVLQVYITMEFQIRSSRILWGCLLSQRGAGMTQCWAKKRHGRKKGLQLHPSAHCREPSINSTLAPKSLITVVYFYCIEFKRQVVSSG